MPYKTGSWGLQAQLRSVKRREYFRKRHNYHGVNSLGYVGEKEALTILKGSKKIYRPCDLIWNNKLVDVKTAIFSTKKDNWNFLLYREKGKVDYFLIICKNIDKKTKYIFLIPDKDLKLNNLVISENNIYKYIKYLWK